jgi:hypothetical protein
VFHLECLKTKLSRGWNAAAIDFSFLKCPLCESRVKHPAFNAIMAPFLALEEKVGVKAMERLAFEGLEQDKAIIERGGRFFQQPRAFAMHHFAFYQCFSCNNPYFAGARACGAAEAQEEIKKEDLFCAACQKVESQESCKTHGNDWLSFKCRFCCSNAVWHCWNKTHFCEPWYVAETFL